MINKILKFLVTYILVVPKAHLLNPITISDLHKYRVVPEYVALFGNNRRSLTVLRREIDQVISYDYQVAFDVDEYIYKTTYKNYYDFLLEGIELEWYGDPFNFSGKVQLENIRKVK